MFDLEALPDEYTAALSLIPPRLPSMDGIELIHERFYGRLELVPKPRTQ